MRLFVALDIDDNIRNRIARFLDGIRGLAPDARWVRPESLHVTLKFIGEQSETQVEAIKRTLKEIDAEHFELNFRGYGFFPSARAPRVFWVGIDEDAKLTSLAASVDSKLIELNIQEEQHAYNAHLTLGRIGGSASPRREKSDRPNRNFQHLQKKLSALPTPEFGTMTAREFFLYQSLLSPSGSKYTKLAGFSLR
ncbi:MAG: RNA 2',3'-cyclic phosphodiesterase [Candidatus Sulfotelmatobacter sp.]|jgi:RNA 2',3'-cyclic 3'-phosphodiesterase